MLTIRQITDPILHSKPYRVNFNNPAHFHDIFATLPILQKNLHHLGGVGIAANQCSELENPPQMIIVGTNQPGPAQARYPDRVIPNEIIMINPEIISYSNLYYPERGEGCLSVKSSLRARVPRYKTITLEYFDMDGQYFLKTYDDFTAHIIQHEYEHLQGIVYLQKAISELSREQVAQFLTIIETAPTSVYEITSPLIVIDRDMNSKPMLQLDNLKRAIAETHPIALAGIKHLLIEQSKASSEA